MKYIPIAMQMKLISGTWSKDQFAFGGALLKGSHPKKKRHYRAELPLHVVMKSTLARGEKSLFRSNVQVAKIIETQASRHNIRIYAAANAGNHLHLLIQAPARPYLRAFLKAVAGRVAELLEIKWDARPFSRIVGWGRDFKHVLQYIGINSTEMVGLSRDKVRAMFNQIQAALKSGVLAKTPGLVAAGFA